MWQNEQQGLANKIDTLIINRNKVFPPTEFNVRNFIKTIAQDPLFIEPTKPNDDIAQIVEGNRRKTLLKTTELKTPLNKYMTCTNYFAFFHMLIAMLSLEYRYPMPDLILACMVASMNLIQVPAWKLFTYTVRPNTGSTFQSAQYGNQQRRLVIDNQERGYNSIFWLIIYAICVLAIDIVWCVFYPTQWWNSNYIDNGEQSFARKWSIIFGLILPFSTIGLIVCLCVSGKNAPEFRKVPMLNM